GYGAYYIHGVHVTEKIVMRPDELTVAEIGAEPNAEIRRVMVDQLGAERFLVGTKAKKIHSDRCGELYRREMRDDEPILMVKLLNSTPERNGTRRTYWKRVPPTIKTAHKAVAWLHNRTPETYLPELEA